VRIADSPENLPAAAEESPCPPEPCGKEDHTAFPVFVSLRRGKPCGSIRYLAVDKSLGMQVSQNLGHYRVFLRFFQTISADDVEKSVTLCYFNARPVFCITIFNILAILKLRNF